MDNFALAQQLGSLLQQNGWTLSTAESCTGGLILSILTDIAGSSAYVEGGLVSYSNAAKQHLLGVREATLLEYGAVSEATAGEMARAAQRLFATDYALSVTGIAGPGGGTDAKPVGLTYIGLAGRGERLCVQRHIWNGDRIQNKAASVEAALRLLLGAVQAESSPAG